MQITNVKVDIFNWTTEPWKTGVGAQFGATRQLGVVSVETDEGITGNAFLGSSRMGAEHFVPGLIEFIKPMLPLWCDWCSDGCGGVAHTRISRTCSCIVYIATHRFVVIAVNHSQLINLEQC